MELVKKEESFNPVIEIENTKKICESLMRAPHYAKMGQEGIYAIVSKAKSLGMDPIEALNGGLYYVKGRVGMSAEAMAARMRAAGHSVQKDPKSTPTNCILNGKRGDNGDIWQVSFSVEDAKRAGIYQEGGAWGKYPQSMCYNRAVSMLYRQLTPDLSKGVGYQLDELREIADSDKIQPMPVVEERELITQDQASELLSLLELCDPAYVRKLWDTLRRPPIGISSLNQLPADLYDRIKSAALLNKKEIIEKIDNKEEIQQEIQEEQIVNQ